MIEAIDKLKREQQELKSLSKKGNAVKSYVVDVLCEFCRNPEFSQAVMQASGTLKDCIESTIKGTGESVSDIDVCKKAVQFYFPDATVHCSLTIDLGDGGFSNAPEEPPQLEQAAPITLSFDSLLDF